jgi:hypothetical protein
VRCVNSLADLTPIELLQSNICKMVGVMTSDEESCDEHHDFPNLPNAHVISYEPVNIGHTSAVVKRFCMR